MKTKLHWLFAICVLFSTSSLFAQQTPESLKPFYVGTPTKIEHVPSIASRTTLVRPEYRVEEMMATLEQFVAETKAGFYQPENEGN